MSDTFDLIEKHYPEIIKKMKSEFDSHDFILVLAQQYQGLYIKVLARHEDDKTPFRAAHAELARRLHNFPDLIEKVKNVQSPNIFGEKSEAAYWRKK